MITTCLKWKYCRKLREEHEYLTSTWYVQMMTDRTGIDVPLHCSPSLQAKVPEILADEYPHAVFRASMETDRKESRFPETLEWTLEEMIHFPLDPLIREDTIKGYDLVLSRELDMWEAYSPQFPFHCIAFGKTPEEAKLNFADVLAQQIAGMRESGEPIPETIHPINEDNTFDGSKGEYDWSKDIERCRRPYHEVLAETRVRSAAREALHADDFE